MNNPLGRPSAAPALFSPPPINSVEDTGLSHLWLQDLALKILYSQGYMSGFKIAELIALPFAGVTDGILEALKREKMLEVKSSQGGLGEGAYTYGITGAGIIRAREALERSQYAGPAPVPFEVYNEAIRRQKTGRMTVTSRMMRQILSQMVISESTFQRLGPALNSGTSIFMYGPPGNGKTSVALDNGGGLNDEVYGIALQTDGAIVLAGRTEVSPGNYDFAVVRLLPTANTDVTFGTTGEATSFPVAQRIDLMRGFATGSVDLGGMLVGTGAAAVADAVTLTREAAALGFGGALVLPPFYYKNVPDEGVVRYVGNLVEETADSGIPVYLYNFPALSGVPYGIGLLSRLLTTFGDRVAGLKDSSGDLAYAREAAALSPGFSVFPSSEATLGEVRNGVFAGCISATANVSAAWCRKAPRWATAPTPPGSSSPWRTRRRPGSLRPAMAPSRPGWRTRRRARGSW